MAPSDEILISQAVELKDTEAFGELVRRYQTRILVLQRRLTRDASLAEDLSQDTFLRAWQKLHTYKGSGSFGGWLSALAYNVFLQHQRRHKRTRAETELFDEELTGDTPDETTLSDLDRLLGVLDEKDQTILTLVYACGLTNQECGEVLGMPSGTIKARIHRAKVRIQAHLSGDLSVPTGGTKQEHPTVDLRRRARKPRFFAQLTGAYRT